MDKQLKICLACSVGGHLTQMRQLEKLYKKYDYFFLTEETDLTIEMGKNEKVYLLRLVNREKLNFIFLMIINFYRSLKILIKENPDIVISTGVLSAIPCCLFAKLLGKRLIYIESFAKVSTPTETGKLLYRFADLFIVQSEKLLDFYPKAVYGGSIY